MHRSLLPLVLGLCVSSAAWPQARPPIPSVVLDHMNELERRCVAAGGRAGQGRFVVAQDFTGDGRLDYLLSEGDYDCVGRPGLFRNGGVARVDLFVVDARNAARRVYSDQLIAYRVLAGTPAKVQIARQGAACGPGSTARTQCAAQLAWNGHGFGEAVAVSDARTPAQATAAAPGGAPRAADAARLADSGAAVASGAAPAALAVAPDARPRYLVDCRQAYVSRSADAARWADEQCVADWNKITASAAATDALLAALPAAPGEVLPLASLRQRLSAVRWAAKPGSRELSASGRLGEFEVSVTGSPAAKTLGVNWGEVGAEPPYDIVGAMRARGVTLTEIACEEFGSGEWQRVFAGSAPGRAPFRLEIGQRIAPTANANSYYSATIDLSGRAPTVAVRQVCTNPSNLIF
ncbi:MAG TPA: hypothetical protein DCL01_13515 [Thauera sp.]|nr:hypothetical protein [Thauera sp.]HHW64503.1 hypothetical protein [Rhodocyclaceae bacterium]